MVACPSWLQPANWVGPCPVLYRSLDDHDGITSMEGTNQVDWPLTPGKVTTIYERKAKN